MTSTHGGNLRALAAKAGLRCEDVLDFSASINPLGPPECVRAVISRQVDALVHYPDPHSSDLVAAIAAAYAVEADQIIVGNGSSEILFALASAIKLPRALVPVPSYIDYATAAQRAGMQVDTLTLREDEGFALNLGELEGRLTGGEMVILGQPNNPTGLCVDAAELRRMAGRHPATTFVVDEAFADFIEGGDTLMRDVQANVVVLRSLTKFYAIPGLRLGFAVASRETAAQIRRQLTPWSVNTLAQAVGAAMLADKDYATRTCDLIRQQRQFLTCELGKLPGLYVYPGQANFLLVRINRSDIDAPTLADRLLSQGIAIRVCKNFPGLDGRFFRLAVRTQDQNERLVTALAAALGAPRQVAKPRRTPAIMFQGTSSNAGKSVLTAALCRILLQDGLRVAPYKSQNMSLNSFVTADGFEMGRAQVVQAQACRLDADVRMNPILLKPNSDTGSQVIVMGKPVGNMRVMEYVRYKPTAFAAAKEAYDSLAASVDAMVIEGAGSPGEVNLKSHDIVNMRVAEYAGAPVLIVGDIDRGGVFASFVGTMEVLAPWERALVAGWVVNRFRGDARLLGDALDYTLAHTGRPVLGVVPYLPALNIPQEDSVEFKSGAIDDRRDGEACVEVAVIDLPHISNFTDFDALMAERDVRVRIVRGLDDLATPDAIVIPGSKNTLADMAYLKRSGLAKRIAEIAAANGAEIVGICGGFQMLGRSILDPQCIESAAGRDDGLGLLPVQTVLAAEKTLVRSRARHTPSGHEVIGYEIHHGLTDGDDAAGGAMFVREDGVSVGSSSADGRVWGTYLHGVFDADEFRRWFIDRLRARRGLVPLGEVCTRYDIEPALDRLADTVRQSLDMKRIYQVMGL